MSTSLWARGSTIVFHKKADPNPRRGPKEYIRALFDYWPALLIFAMAIVGAVETYLVLQAAESKNSDNTFIQHASDRATVLVWELQRVIGDLQIVTAYMAISYDWREDYFREKFKNLTAGILDRSPGTQGLTWVPMVWSPSERAYLEEQQGRQLNLGGPPAQMRNSSLLGRPVRCIYYKDAAGANLCSPAAPGGGPMSAAGPGVEHAFFPVLFLEPVNDPTGFRRCGGAARQEAAGCCGEGGRRRLLRRGLAKGSRGLSPRLCGPIGGWRRFSRRGLRGPAQRVGAGLPSVDQCSLNSWGRLLCRGVAKTLRSGRGSRSPEKPGALVRSLPRKRSCGLRGRGAARVVLRRDRTRQRAGESEGLVEKLWRWAFAWSFFQNAPLLVLLRGEFTEGSQQFTKGVCFPQIVVWGVYRE
jgi:hypothetical protein